MNRRKFFKKSAVAAAAIATVATPIHLLSGCSRTAAIAKMPLRPDEKTGLILYTVRGDMDKDPMG
ncbi:MAG: twin-arginine translocation signal domain-containing protein, partial [Bacteroidales bacterium]|nr:twin-arginine translocation signal domain-containing protein [Bacteroidales bacterium]